MKTQSVHTDWPKCECKHNIFSWKVVKNLPREYSNQSNVHIRSLTFHNQLCIYMELSTLPYAWLYDIWETLQAVAGENNQTSQCMQLLIVKLECVLKCRYVWANCHILPINLQVSPFNNWTPMLTSVPCALINHLQIIRGHA